MVKESALRVLLHVKGYDKEGNLIGERIIDDDLILDNFANFLRAHLQEWDTNFITFTLKGTDGATRSYCLNSTTNNGPPFNLQISSGSGSRIALGTGTISPARTDFVLTGSTEMSAESAVWTSSQGKISWATTFIFDPPTTVTEAGWLLRMWYFNFPSTLYTILMFRNTFSGLSAPIFTVEYALIFQ